MWGGLLVTVIVFIIHVGTASISMLAHASNGIALDYERHYNAVRTLPQDLAAIEKGATNDVLKLEVLRRHYRGVVEAKGFGARDLHWVILQLPLTWLTLVGCLGILVSVLVSALCAWTVVPKSR